MFALWTSYFQHAVMFIWCLFDWKLQEYASHRTSKKTILTGPPSLPSSGVWNLKCPKPRPGISLMTCPMPHQCCSWCCWGCFLYDFQSSVRWWSHWHIFCQFGFGLTPSRSYAPMFGVYILLDSCYLGIVVLKLFITIMRWETDMEISIPFRGGWL